MPCLSALNRYTNIVDKMTDVSGAAADTQKNLGFTMLCKNMKSINQSINPDNQFVKKYEITYDVSGD